MRGKRKFYRDYQVEDFLIDESFISWVKESKGQAFWDEVFGQYPHLVPLSEQAAEIILMMDFSKGEVDHQRTSRLKQKIDRRIENVDSEANVIAMYKDRKSPEFNRINITRWAIGLAAGMAAILTIAFWPDHSQQDPVIPQVAIQTKSTKKGQKLTTRLSDGTIVTLNSDSHIKFEEVFNDTVRYVTLEGEAFFDVAKDTRPFRVRSNGTVTTALGTSFNIKQNGEKIIISLLTGKVGVNMRSPSGMTESTLLDPGQQVSVDMDDQISFVKGNFSTMDVLAWKHGVLSFRNATTEEVWRELEKWYGVEIHVQNQRIQQQKWNYTGSFDNESLENVLESIGFVKGFHFKISGDQVKIY